MNEYLEKVRNSQQDGRGRIRVLDMGCGKGGDLQKWQRAGVSHVVGVDIAATSIEQCKDRYHEMKGSSMQWTAPSRGPGTSTETRTSCSTSSAASS